MSYDQAYADLLQENARLKAELGQAKSCLGQALAREDKLDLLVKDQGKLTRDKQALENENLSLKADEETMKREIIQLIGEKVKAQTDLAKTKAERDELREALASIQWSANIHEGFQCYCPKCEFHKDRGHSEACEVGNALSKII